MRGVVYLGDSEIEIHTFEDPKPGPGEVVLEVKASGLCGSDLMPYRAPRGEDGYSSRMPARDGRPVIGGHEPCGIVAEVGPGVNPRQAHVGQRVMVHHYHGCGACDLCRSGWPQMCPDLSGIYGFTADGGHADYMVAPAETLVTLPDGVSFEVGSALACGTGTAWGGLVRLDVSGRDIVAVMGQGAVGLGATALAKAMGAQVIAVDITQTRLDAAKRAGADVVIDGSRGDVVEAIMEATDGRGVTKALEASGTEQGRLNAIGCTRAWGSICFVGLLGTVTIEVPKLITRQHTIMGSQTLSVVGLGTLARFVLDREVPIGDIITRRGPLDDAAELHRILDTQASDGKSVFVF